MPEPTPEQIAQDSPWRSGAIGGSGEEIVAARARIAELEARIRERHDHYCRDYGWRPGERHAPECLAEDAGVDVGGPDA